jgi:hypothetical protein
MTVRRTEQRRKSQQHSSRECKILFKTEHRATNGSRPRLATKKQQQQQNSSSTNNPTTKHHTHNSLSSPDGIDTLVSFFNSWDAIGAVVVKVIFARVDGQVHTVVAVPPMVVVVVVVVVVLTVVVLSVVVVEAVVVVVSSPSVFERNLQCQSVRE